MLIAVVQNQAKYQTVIQILTLLIHLELIFQMTADIKHLKSVYTWRAFNLLVNMLITKSITL